jgi:raffinose/stachyose/melibiose transport system substrate-binding protein
MNHLKKLSFLFPALAVLVCLSCTGRGKEVASKEVVPVTLRVFNYYDISSADSTEETALVWDAFTEANPEITLIREDFYSEPFHQRLAAYAEAGELPDVIYAWPSGRSAALHTQGLLKDLTPLAERDNLAAEYFPAALDPRGQIAGYMGILPRSVISSHAFYVNNEVLRDAGLSPARTYEELKAQVPILRDKGYETVILSNQDPWVMQSCLFSLVAGRFCGEGWERRVLNGESKFTDAEFENALTAIQRLYIDGVLARDSLNTDYNAVVAQFADNKAAYFIDEARRTAAFITNPSTGEALLDPQRQNNIGITVFPDLPGVKFNKSSSVTIGPGWGMRADIPAGSPEEEAAWKLIKWLSGREIQTRLVRSGAVATPSRSDIDTAGLDIEPMRKTLSSLGSEYTTGTAVIDQVFHSDVFTPINDGLQEIATEAMTPPQVARLVQSSLESWQAMNK